jgi:hypothetical protein
VCARARARAFIVFEGLRVSGDGVEHVSMRQF